MAERATEKRCNACGQTKPTTEFYRNNTSGGWSAKCKECQKASVLQWQRENPERFAEHQKWVRVKKKYGLTRDQWWALFRAQEGRCAICGSAFDPEGNFKRIHVDHCHRTGRVRSLLCGGCNVGLGAFNEDAERMRSAAAYAEAWEREVSGDA